MIRKILRWTLIVLLSIYLSARLIASWAYIPSVDSEVLLEISDNSTKNNLPEIFKILIWNVYKGNYKQDWEKDYLNLSQDKDLIFIQEAMIDGWMEKIFSNQSLNFWIAQSFFYSGKKSSTGVANGSTIKANKISFLRSSDREYIINTPKKILVAEYLLSNGAVLLTLNIHGINFVKNSLFEKQIKDAINLIQKHQGPALFVGDFNTWNDSRMNFLKNELFGLGFQHDDFPEDKRTFLLDHLFYRGCSLIEKKLHMDIKTSDHAAITATLNCSN